MGTNSITAIYGGDTYDRTYVRALERLHSTLQADGYAGFDQIYEAGRIQEAACWAHVRRKFYDPHAAHKSPVAAQALERIGAPYAIENEYSRTLARRAARDPQRAGSAVAGTAEAMARNHTMSTIQKIGHRAGGSLCTRTLGSAPALRARWTNRDPQQHRGTSIAHRSLGRKN